MRWIPTELHTHTLHSDGRFTVPSLCECAKQHGLEMIALTDHNTLSGTRELTDELAAKTIPVIQGIEWTAYYGHMLVLACEEYVDWRETAKSDMDRKMEMVQKGNGLVGIAHPYAIGSPICTGCCWEYDVSAWDKVNYIEVWSGEFPSVHRGRNGRAEEMWQRLLDQGYHLAATYGRDWHVDAEDKAPWGCTYLAVEEITPSEGVAALRGGRTMVTMGPRPIAEIYDEQTRRELYPGGTVRTGSTLLMHLGMDMESRQEEWEKFRFVPERAQIVGKGGCVLAETQLEPDAHLRFTAPDSYFRIIYCGRVMDRSCAIAFTSPYYTAVNARLSL